MIERVKPCPRATEPPRPDFVQRAIEQVEQKRLENILWTPRRAQREDHLGAQGHTEPFRIYLIRNYLRVQSFSGCNETSLIDSLNPFLSPSIN